MGLIISVPQSADSTQTVSLNAINVDLNFRWNTISDSWSLDISVGGTILKEGVVFKSDRDFTGQYIDLTKKLNGVFYCKRISKDKRIPLNFKSFTEGTHQILFLPNL